MDTKNFHTLTMGKVRSELYDLIKDKEPVVVTCYGNKVAYVVPAEDFERLLKIDREVRMASFKDFYQKQADTLKAKKKALQSRLDSLPDCEEKELVQQELFFVKQELNNYLEQLI